MFCDIERFDGVFNLGTVNAGLVSEYPKCGFPDIASNLTAYSPLCTSLNVILLSSESKVYTVLPNVTLKLWGCIYWLSATVQVIFTVLKSTKVGADTLHTKAGILKLTISEDTVIVELPADTRAFTLKLPLIEPTLLGSICSVKSTVNDNTLLVDWGITYVVSLKSTVYEVAPESRFHTMYILLPDEFTEKVGTGLSTLAIYTILLLADGRYTLYIIVVAINVVVSEPLNGSSSENLISIWNDFLYGLPVCSYPLI